ncbi:uncharacterized protein LOC114538195 [Dendronephthya gigantea]|uniref:uncharacterized protein LOC114538195 n=1 Tax=Dendronephthya gigantea TaxID=151771 RepID=UPI001068DA57|nr:uncharacterized protein LOC114538195 [Dendronephthya gigantea]
MFSFWSMEDDENSNNSNESDGERDKSGKPERFRYVSTNNERTSQLSDNVFQNKRNVKAFKEKRKQMDDMLKDVWSVRKDVRVNNAVKASDVGQKSYYSRHGRVSGLPTETSHLQDTARGNHSTKTWSVPRQGYSYSENADLNQIDILGENNTHDLLENSNDSPLRNHHPDVHRQNIVNSLKHGTAGPNVTNRELSARTKRAQKFNNAYLRSTGMGQYTPHVTKSSDHYSNNSKDWNS